MKYLLILLFIPLAHASEWHYAAGVGLNYYGMPDNNVWWNQGQPFKAERTNYALFLEAKRSISDNSDVKIGAYIPQVNHFVGWVQSDACHGSIAKCGALGAMLVDTSQQGIYATWSPHYDGFFADVGLWLFRQHVTATLDAIPNPNNPANPAYAYMDSTVYRINPVLGIGYNMGKWEIEGMMFDSHPRDGVAQPPGCNQMVETVSVKYQLD